MPHTDDVRRGVNPDRARATIMAAVRDAATLARKQALIVLGAGDAVMDTIIGRAESVPQDAQRTVGRVTAVARSGVATALGSAGTVTSSVQTGRSTARRRVAETAAELRHRGGAAVSSTRGLDVTGTATHARAAVTGRVEQARSTLDELAERGERVTRSVRRDPRLLRALGEADRVAETAADGVTSVAQKVRARAVANDRSITARKAAATRAAAADRVTVTPARAAVTRPAKSAPAKRSPAKRSPAKASPAKRSPAKSSPVKSSPAKSSPVKSSPAETAPVKASPPRTAPAKASPRAARPTTPAAARSTGRRGGAAPKR